MVYLNLDKDGRVLSVQKMPETPVAVDTLPEGDIADYRYFDLAFIKDPLPPSPEPAQEPTMDDICAALAELAALIGG